MGVTALLMAGGEGTRLKTAEEKPLLKVGGKPVIEYVLNALKDAKKVEEIIVAVSKHTPKTAAFARKHYLKVLQTPGKGFCLDTRYAIKKLKIGTVLTICADLPLITSEFIDKVITHYEQCKKPALTVMAPLENYKKFGLSADYIFKVKGKNLVPIGVNVVDGKRINEAKLEEEIFIIRQEEIAVNVNRIEDLEIAERLFKKETESR
ncbi:MAG: NTP transferase domain-containing protein [Candidatus Bathyarchaeia archaeon]|jgi:adenosylcobinamide-phosphate guanylyltransferase